MRNTHGTIFCWWVMLGSMRGWGHLHIYLMRPTTQHPKRVAVPRRPAPPRPGQHLLHAFRQTIKASLAHSAHLLCFAFSLRLMNLSYFLFFRSRIISISINDAAAAAQGGCTLFLPGRRADPADTASRQGQGPGQNATLATLATGRG